LDDSIDALNQISRLVTASTKTMCMLGARTLVLGKFFDAAVSQLTTLQKGEVAWSFRHGVEDVMSLMDDVTLPAEYHSTLLELTNDILAALGQESARRQ
jgi:hypothetical protein